jgi:hypothetical protein
VEGGRGWFATCLILAEEPGSEPVGQSEAVSGSNPPFRLSKGSHQTASGLEPRLPPIMDTTLLSEVSSNWMVEGALKMTESDDHRRDVAGRFIQATQIHIHNLIFRWFPPEVASHMIDVVMKEVEDEGLQVEGIKVICGWFRSDTLRTFRFRLRQNANHLSNRTAVAARPGPRACGLRAPAASDRRGWPRPRRLAAV